MAKSEQNTVPISEKYTLTIKEAAVYFNIGEKKLRQLIQENPGAEFVLMNGAKGLIKRRLFEVFIDETGSI